MSKVGATAGARLAIFLLNSVAGFFQSLRISP